MRLTEENHIEKINSYSLEKWLPLFELLADCKNDTNYGELVESENITDNLVSVPYWARSEVIQRFVKIMSSIPILIDFDWMSWNEGEIILKDSNFDFNKVNKPIKCKLLTTLVRKDRYCDGVLIQAFNSGQIHRIVNSIAKDFSCKNLKTINTH